MSRSKVTLTRPALISLLIGVPLAQTTLSQTPPPGMVAVPSFDSVPVPSPQQQPSSPTYPQNYPQPYPLPGSQPYPQTYPQPYPQTYPSADPTRASPEPSPAPYPQPYPGTGAPYPTTPTYPSPASDAPTDCGPDPTGECAARALGQAVATLANTFRDLRFDLQRARSTPCPEDNSLVWSNCFGTLRTDNGAAYEGTFFSDQRHGSGTYRFADGELYSGEFRNNQPSGRGQTNLTNGDLYVGEFRDGRATGQGSYIFAGEGARLVGEFRNMMANGRGVLYLDTGEVVKSGEWKDDFLIRETRLDLNAYAFTRDFGMVEVPGGSPGPASAPAAPRSATPVEAPPAPVRQPAPPAEGRSCTPGPALEPIDYASPEYIGLPEGRRARMCFYRSEGSSVSQLKFYPGGIFRLSSQTGSGGFAMSGAVYQAERGVYGLTDKGQLNLHIAYSGTGVAQTTRGAGSSSSLDVSGADRLDREMTLPNCQTITLREEARRASLGPAQGRGHPGYLILDGVRWERDTDCGDWEGWK